MKIVDINWPNKPRLCVEIRRYPDGVDVDLTVIDDDYNENKHGDIHASKKLKGYLKEAYNRGVSDGVKEARKLILNSLGIIE